MVINVQNIMTFIINNNIQYSAHNIGTLHNRGIRSKSCERYWQLQVDEHVNFNNNVDYMIGCASVYNNCVHQLLSRSNANSMSTVITYRSLNIVTRESQSVSVLWQYDSIDWPKRVFEHTEVFSVMTLIS